jgi:uncharacterized membrane protein YidH (DUF202 family)
MGGHARPLIAFGAVAAAAGLAIAATAPIASGKDSASAQQLLGGVVILGGWAALAWGIHRFGRASED